MPHPNFTPDDRDPEPLTEHDEGELYIGVAVHPERDIMVLDFGKPIVWIGLLPENIRWLRDKLTSALAEIEQRSAQVDKS